MDRFVDTVNHSLTTSIGGVLILSYIFSSDCNDPAVSAQVELLIGMLQLVFSFRGPSVAFGYYKSGSSLLWLLRHAECSVVSRFFRTFFQATAASVWVSSA